MNPQQGRWSEEMSELYDKFIQGKLDQFYTRYFKDLKKYYEEGELITQIHSLEMILNIVLGGKWKQDSIDKSEKYFSNLYEASDRMDQVKSPQPTLNTIEKDKEEKETLADIISWLEDTLPEEEEQHILKVYFIFIKTYWEYLNEENPFFERLYLLHKTLLKSKKYAKFEVLERLNSSSFSKDYKMLR